MTPENLLIQEHAVIRECFAKLDKTIDPKEMAAGLVDFQSAIQKHFRREEPYYTLIDSGKRFHDRGLMHTLRNDHAAVLFTLESLKIRLRKSGVTPEWKERYAMMRIVLLSHLETEEKELFPKALSMLSATEQETLLKGMNADD